MTTPGGQRRCGPRRSLSRRPRTNPKIGALLRGLADGSIELTHEAFGTLPASRSVAYVRGLLVVNRALPPRDQTLATFQRWLQTKLDTIPGNDDRQLVHRFARRQRLRDLRRHAERGPVSKGAFLRAKQSIT